MSAPLLAEAASGAVFGVALLCSGVYEPHIIKAQMLFANSHMLQVFLGGSATSAIVLDAADRSGLVCKRHRPPSNLGLFSYDGNLLGGALIGLGMATTGACPGTGLVQLGTGMTNGVLVVLGGILGASVFVKIQPSLQRKADAATAPDAPTDSPMTASPPTEKPSKSFDIPSALSIHPLGMLLLWLPMCLAVITIANIIDGRRSLHPAPSLLPPAYGGILIGIAQAATVLLARHHIGTSAAYEDLARWITLKRSAQRTADTPAPSSLITPSVAFATGIITSVALLKPFIRGSQLHTAGALSLPFVARTIAGGASMVFGARVAGGCTSGHGISGLSKFSIASLYTTVAMFAGGVLSAQVLGA